MSSKQTACTTVFCCGLMCEMFRISRIWLFSKDMSIAPEFPENTLLKGGSDRVGRLADLEFCSKRK